VQEEDVTLGHVPGGLGATYTHSVPGKPEVDVQECWIRLCGDEHMSGLGIITWCC
jgi:hypothetical protein